MHPNIINPELDEFLLRLPKTPNLPRVENFGVLPLFHTGRGDKKVGGDEGDERDEGDEGEDLCPMPNPQCPNSIMQCVADTTHSLNEALFVIGFKFQTQVAHLKFDNLGIADEVVTPDFF